VQTDNTSSINGDMRETSFKRGSHSPAGCLTTDAAACGETFT